MFLLEDGKIHILDTVITPQSIESTPYRIGKNDYISTFTVKFWNSFWTVFWTEFKYAKINVIELDTQHYRNQAEFELYAFASLESFLEAYKEKLRSVTKEDHFRFDPYPGTDGVSQELWDNRELNQFGWDGLGEEGTQRIYPITN